MTKSDEVASDPPKRATISVLEPGIVLVVNPSKLVPETAGEIFDEITNLVQEAGWEKFWLISDVRATRLPDTPTRHELSSQLSRLEPQLNGVLVVLGGNVVMRAAAKFIFHFSSGRTTTTFHKDVDDALQHTKNANP